MPTKDSVFSALMLVMNEGGANELQIVKLPFELKHSHCSTKQLYSNLPSAKSPRWARIPMLQRNSLLESR